MKKYFFCLTLAFLLFIMNTYGQDSIIMYNGKSIIGKVHDDKNQTYISYQIRKRHKVKTYYIYKENIFGIYYKDSVSNIFYVAEPTTIGGSLSLPEMQSYISGENMARYNYHPRWATVCGTVAGLGGIYFGFYGLLVPTAYVVIAAATPVKPIKNKNFPAEQMNNEFYKNGFKQEAKRKKLVNAIIGGVSGIVVLGTTLGILTSQGYKSW